MNEIGVRRIVAPVVCGSLHMDVELGTFVVSDQFVDRTWGRLSIVTDYDVGMEGGGAVSALSVARTITEQREHLRALLDAAIPRIGPQPTDVCSTALGRARVRF
jgi:purine nucleoside phosphorylase